MAWPMFERVARQSRRLDEMMQRLEINPATAARRDRGLALPLARSRCLTCTQVRLCGLWLHQAPMTPPTPDFCPNALFLDACRLGGKQSAEVLEVLRPD